MLSLCLYRSYTHLSFYRMYATLNIDSWNQYELTLIQPVLSFENYQATCLLSTGTVTYDSSFSNELSTNNYQVFVSAGGEGNDLVVSATVVPSNVYACTFQLYFKVTLEVLIQLFRGEFLLLPFYLFISPGTTKTMHFSSLQSKNGAQSELVLLMLSLQHY